MRSERLARTVALATGGALFAWFIFVTRGGLTSWFDNDDLMNIFYCWSRPWSALLKANLEFWSTYYRPGGGLFYRTIFDLYGFHPLPFRMATHVLLYVDFMLLAIVVWQLTGSRWAALIALLLVGVNPSFAAAYFDTGNIYDILAYALFWGAFALYVHFRSARRQLSWGRLALLFVMFIAALDAKEISVSLPVAVALYELFWHTPANWKPAELWRWSRQEGLFAIIGGVADIAYILGKKYGPDSLWLAGPYHPQYSVAAYFQSLSHYLVQLIYKPVTISPPRAGWLLVAMLVVAMVSRRRFLLWAVAFISISLLPLAFIPPRGGSGYFVPSVGWAVYLTGLTAWMLELLTAKRLWLRRAAQVLLFAVLVIKVTPWQREWIYMSAGAAHEMQARYRRYIEQIHTLIPAPRNGARILLLSDAEERDDYDVYFVMMLYYGDPKLRVERMVVWRQNNVHVDLKSYDYILDWVDNKFVLVSYK